MSLKETLQLRLFGFFKIPMLAYVRPSVVEITDEKCVLKIPLIRRTKNHLNCMYFGALSVGADCASGLIAMRLIQAEGNRVNLIFKDFQAEFLKRVEGDLLITCTQGKEIRELVKKALESSDSVEM